MEGYILNTNKVKSLIIKSGLTQGEFANLLKIKEDKFSSMINQYMFISEKSLNELATLLKMNPDELTVSVEQKKERPLRKSKKMSKKIIIKPSKGTVSMKKNSLTLIPFDIDWNYDYLKELLFKHNISITNFAIQNKMNPSNFSKYARHLYNISLENLYSICKTLPDCSAEKLIGVSIQKLNSISPQYQFDTYGIKENVKTNVKERTIISETGKEKADEDMERLKVQSYKSFPDQNVINNLSIMNENILHLVADLGKSNQIMVSKINELEEANHSLLKKIEGLEKMSVSWKVEPSNTTIQVTKKKESSLVTTKAAENSLSKSVNVNKLLEGKINVSEDTYDDYKAKIFALVKFTANKKNLIFNQILHDEYEKLTKVYGFNLDELKKSSNTKIAMEAIYENPLCREIFYNSLITEASTDYRKISIDEVLRA
jgi:hypothetical protein